MLKMAGSAIVFQEVPDEISLAIEITGCVHACEGCHSKHLWRDCGEEVAEQQPKLLQKYDEYITCVCFMGGDHDQRELIELAKIVKKKRLKTCLYTGCDSITDLDINLLEVLNYVKVGHWDATRGPLSDPNTNQRFYKCNVFQTSTSQKTLIVTDITSKFRRKEL